MPNLANLQDHKHEDLPDDGGKHQHWHLCEKCEAPFTHKHVKRTEEESRKYGQSCRSCRLGEGKVTAPQPVAVEANPADPEPKDEEEEIEVPVDPSDIEHRLRAYIQLRANGLKRDQKLYAAMTRVATTWLKDNGVKHEQDQVHFISLCLDSSLQLTPMEEKLRGRAMNPLWQRSFEQARDIGRGLIDLRTPFTTGVATGLAMSLAVLAFWVGWKVLETASLPLLIISPTSFSLFVICGLAANTILAGLAGRTCWRFLDQRRVVSIGHE